MVEEKRPSKGKTVAIIILVILLIGSLSYIAYDLYFYKYFKKEVKVVEKKKETKTELKEVELKDNTIKKQVLKNLEQITNIDMYDRNYAYSGGIIFDKEKVLSKDIPESFKLYSAIISDNLNFEPLDIKCNNGDCKITNNEITEFQKSKLSIDGGRKFKISDIEKNIKEVYGTEFKYNNELSSGNNCPLIPVATDEFLYTNESCGDAGFDRIEKYVYNVTIKENKVYVYVAVGFISFPLQNDGMEEVKVNFYTNLEKEEYLENTEDFKINENNYQEFSKYKITFEKNNQGDYIFKESVRIEK